jgi:hypothetical protein
MMWAGLEVGRGRAGFSVIVVASAERCSAGLKNWTGRIADSCAAAAGALSARKSTPVASPNAKRRVNRSSSNASRDFIGHGFAEATHRSNDNIGSIVILACASATIDSDGRQGPPPWMHVQNLCAADALQACSPVWAAGAIGTAGASGHG